MRHVWILNHYAQEPGGPGGTRHFALARNLPPHGWRATIIAAGTDHASGRQRLEPGEASRLESFDGVPFLWLRTRPYTGNGRDRIGNMIDYTRAALSRERLARLDRPDLVIGSSVHPLAAWAGLCLARRHGVPFVFEVRDLWPQTLIDMGRLTPRHPAAVAMRWLERRLCRGASRIVVLARHAADYFVPLGVEPDRIVWIANGVDLDRFPSRPATPDAGCFTLMYLGALGEANGLDTLIAAMAIVAAAPGGDRVRLRIVGQGPRKASLVAMAGQAGLEAVSFEDPVPKNAIPDLAAGADAFVACLRDLPGLYRYGISMNKLFDYMAAARPVILAADAPGNPVAEAGAGMTVRPEDPRALAEAILDMAAMTPERRGAMGEAGRRHLEDTYAMDHLAGRLARTLDACVGAA